jgi:hypothetical protein
MMPAAMKGELGMMAQRFDASRKLGLEQSRIYRFNRRMLEFLETQVPRFRTLSRADFHASVRMYDAQVLQLHADLQRAMVNATTGSGETNELKLNEWLVAHRAQIDALKRYWQ